MLQTNLIGKQAVTVLGKTECEIVAVYFSESAGLMIVVQDNKGKLSRHGVHDVMITEDNTEYSNYYNRGPV